MNPLVVAVVALLGAAVGRAAAFAVERVPLTDPQWRSPRTCPACGVSRSARAKAPVVGPVLARCTKCGARVAGWEAPFDVVMAIVFGLLAWRLEEPAVLAVFLVLGTSLVTLAMIDLQTLRLPDRLTMPTFLGGIVLLGAAGLATGRGVNLVPALVGAASYFGILLLAHLVHPRGMGFGDVKLALSMGLFLGWLAPSSLEAFRIVLYAMLMGFGGGTVIGLVLMAVRRRSAPYPFGPFLVVGTLLAILLSDSIIR